MDGPGAFLREGRVIPLNSADAEVALAGGNVRSLRIASGTSEIRASGTIGSLAEPLLDLTAQAKLTLQELEPVLQLQNISGDLNLRVRVKGRTPNPEVQAEIDSDLLRVGALPELTVHVETTYDRDANRLRVSVFTARSSLFAASGDADLSLDTQAGQNRANVVLQSLEVFEACGKPRCFQGWGSCRCPQF
jgi:autotransporter translocation and assembly factor TamB